jgi:putative transposase
LSQPEIADIIKEALRYRDGKVFDLHTFSIMSNHVHVVFEPLSTPGWQPDPSSNLNHPFDLPKLMQSLKRHTARQANITLGRVGPFWQDESYDRVIRNNEEYIRTVDYVLENPVKARLVSRWEAWKWTYCKPAGMSKLESHSDSTL